MAYTPYYPGGWQSGEEGGTPITPAALNNMETGIGAALTPSDIVNSLTSTSTTAPLSANMGKALNDKKVRYYTGSAYVSTAYDLLLLRATVDFSNGIAEKDIASILTDGGYTGSVAGCFAIIGAVPATSVITACAFSSTTKKVTMSAKSTVDGSNLSVNNVAVNILLLVT